MLHFKGQPARPECPACRFGDHGAGTCPARGKVKGCLNGQWIEGWRPPPPAPPIRPANLLDPKVRALRDAWKREQGIPHNSALTDAQRRAFDRHVHDALGPGAGT